MQRGDETWRCPCFLFSYKTESIGRARCEVSPRDQWRPNGPNMFTISLWNHYERTETTIRIHYHPAILNTAMLKLYTIHTVDIGNFQSFKHRELHIWFVIFWKPLPFSRYDSWWWSGMAMHSHYHQYHFHFWIECHFIMEFCPNQMYNIECLVNNTPFKIFQSLSHD